MTVHITALYTYPIKSCGRLQHDQIAVAARGLLLDRRWMIVGAEDSAFLTQRALPRLALIQPSLTDAALTLSAPDMPPLSVPLSIPADAPTMPVAVWRDTAIAHDEGEDAADWLSAFLARSVRLVRMADAHYRRVDPVYSPEPAQIGFADGYPILLTNESSLDELNVRLQLRGKAPISMTRFRPNIVVSGAPAFAEDGWSAFSINGIAFEGVKPCARCVITTIDQDTGGSPDPQEPTATLATFRRHERGVLFGQNVVQRGQGMIAVGDAVQIGA